MFIVGGTTYAEAATIHEWNKEHPECNVILGSTMVHNSASFIEEVENFKQQLLLQEGGTGEAGGGQKHEVRRARPEPRRT